MLFHLLKERHASLIILFILILCPSVLFADADRIFRENNKAVVVIVTYDSQGNAIAQGSGFIVKANGAIVTNYHVISNAENIKIKVGVSFRIKPAQYLSLKRPIHNRAA